VASGLMGYRFGGVFSFYNSRVQNSCEKRGIEASSSKKKALQDKEVATPNGKADDVLKDLNEVNKDNESTVKPNGSSDS
jgi:hypothetical protein